jgi:pseudouridine kinase
VARICCIGGASVDEKFHLDLVPTAATSNPARRVSGFGGVARNVAENLARLGVDVALVSAIGRDFAGEAVRAGLLTAGVDTAGLVRSGTYPTGTYVAIIDPAGELSIGVSDLSAVEALTPDDIGHAWPLVASADYVFADCNLNAATLERVIAACGGAGLRLALDAVSIAKSARLPSDLHNVDVLFCNADEAPSCIGRGARALVVTDGPRPVIVHRGDVAEAIPVRPVAAVDVTGAGDSLIAATLVRLCEDDDLATAVRAGVEAAARTVGSLATVVGA